MFVRVFPLSAAVLLAGCGLGPVIQQAERADAGYETCVAQELAAYQSEPASQDLTPDAITRHVITACKSVEDAYVVAMTDLAMAITGDLASRQEFLENEDADLRQDLHDRAADIVAETPQ